MKGKIYKGDVGGDAESLATALLRLSEKIEDNNRLIMTLIRRMEKLELALGKREDAELLSETDERIVKLIEERGKVTAGEVKEALGYKGSNAASARLNKLYSMGVLKKKYAGKKVYFFLAR